MVGNGIAVYKIIISTIESHVGLDIPSIQLEF